MMNICMLTLPSGGARTANSPQSRQMQNPPHPRWRPWGKGVRGEMASMEFWMYPESQQSMELCHLWMCIDEGVKPLNYWLFNLIRFHTCSSQHNGCWTENLQWEAVSQRNGELKISRHHREGRWIYDQERRWSWATFGEQSEKAFCTSRRKSNWCCFLWRCPIKRNAESLCCMQDNGEKIVLFYKIYAGKFTREPIWKFKDCVW